jgi:hypothetical protein
MHLTISPDEMEFSGSKSSTLIAQPSRKNIKIRRLRYL